MYNRLRKNSEFQKVYRQGRFKANKDLVMIVYDSKSGLSRYGFSVSKKVGNSVKRHRITRLLRESVRKYDDRVREDVDVVIIARPSVAGKGQKEVDKSVYHLMKLHKMLV